MPKNSVDPADRLRQQYTEIAQLAGGLAHEVKNPLSTIRLNMELLAEDMEDLPESPQQKRALKRVDVVRRETVRLEELLNEFLHFTRAHHLELSATDINKEVREILDFFKPQADEMHVEIQEYLSPDLPTVRLDKRSFHRAVLNLFLNAAQAMKEGGQIIVRTRMIGGNVALDIIDTGCGIDNETVGKIFTPFFSTKRGGSGLGLPTVRKIIEGHGGRIAIQSEPGCGTQFTLTFPVLAQIAEAPPPSVVILPSNTQNVSQSGQDNL